MAVQHACDFQGEPCLRELLDDEVPQIVALIRAGWLHGVLL